MMILNKILKPTTVAVGMLAVLAFKEPVHGGSYDKRVVVSGLQRPTGIASHASSTLFITQLPTPGVSGMNGGMNTVDMIKLHQGVIQNLTTGEPEPTNLTLDKKSTLYWTCKSAGVILQRTKQGSVSLFLGGLTQPNGIAAGPHGLIYFTQLPTPGIGGMDGGMNTVNVTDGSMIQTLTQGEPEPTDIAVDAAGNAYWTCKSAGVILHRQPNGMVGLLLKDLQKPTGIALDKLGRNLFFTEVPTPGMPGSMGGMNRVSVLNLHSGALETVDFGDPEPHDITVTTNGRIYWTCTSAGVIVEATPRAH